MCLGILASLASLSPSLPTWRGVENGHLCPTSEMELVAQQPRSALLRPQAGQVSSREERSHRHCFPLPALPESFQNPERGHCIHSKAGLCPQPQTRPPKGSPGARLLPAQCVPAAHADTVSVFPRGGEEQQ